MSDAATRADIEEVIGIVRDLMQKVDNRFNTIELEIKD